MKQFDYAKPQTLTEASAILQDLDGKGQIIAGGTGLLPSLKQGLLLPDILVDVASLPELTGVCETESGGLSIGACTPLAQLGLSKLVRSRYSPLAEAATGVASPQIRTRATVGGNICLDTRCWYFNQSNFWRQSYADCRKLGGNTCYVVKGGSRCFALMSSDLIPLLVALGAQLEVFNSGRRRMVPVEELFTGDGARPITLGHRDLLTRVLVPRSENTLLGFRKYSTHPPINFGLVTLATAVTVDPSLRAIRGAKLVLGCVDSFPIRCSGVEASLVGADIDSLDFEEVGLAASREVTIFSNVNADQGYKKQIVEWLVSETLADLLQRRQTTEKC
ncbi:MAG: FAD binding domain-containing protein [Chloroflexi bacterium]|nr:FAD binding domain-containing protein [Chloroflexota bacterium]